MEPSPTLSPDDRWGVQLRFRKVALLFFGSPLMVRLALAQGAVLVNPRGDAWFVIITKSNYSVAPAFLESREKEAIGIPLAHRLALCARSCRYRGAARQEDTGGLAECFSAA